MGLWFSKPATLETEPETVRADDPTDAVKAILTPHTDAINAGLSRQISPGNYIALDCEMVGIGPDPDQTSALARISIVNSQGQQIYDSYVLPQEAVTDYRTATSGITAKLLRKARAFKVVQSEVAGLLAGRIIVGHDIRHDLAVLGLEHPKRDVRDTCRYPPYRALVNGSTPGLRMLASLLLSVEIQSGPHSSLEDARAAMALFWREKEEFEKWIGERWGRGNARGRGGRGMGRVGGRGRGRGNAYGTRGLNGTNENEAQAEVDSGDADNDDRKPHKNRKKKSKTKR